MSAALPALRIEDVTVRFGGRIAVNSINLQAEPGTITGLIGPNGAGKTTTFNACTGVVRPTAGRVFLGDSCLNGKGTAARAAAGLGRTFQRMELFDSMTVAENVAMGPEGMFAARRPWGQFFHGRGERAEVASRTATALERCGLSDAADRRVSDLSTGQRRLVELARAVASPFRFLLLDEPSSGLDPHETEIFGEVLSAHVAATGIGVLLVEHDMDLVAAVCSHIYVLDFGSLIWSGPTAEAMTSPVVQAAYLGGEAAEEAALAVAAKGGPDA
jgi:ABC-type branched-subunit amino acid transport system ATPase component